MTVSRPSCGLYFLPGAEGTLEQEIKIPPEIPFFGQASELGFCKQILSLVPLLNHL